MEVHIKMDDEIKGIADKFSKEIAQWKDKLDNANKDKTLISDRFLEMKLKYDEIEYRLKENASTDT